MLGTGHAIVRKSTMLREWRHPGGLSLSGARGTTSATRRVDAVNATFMLAGPTVLPPRPIPHTRRQQSNALHAQGRTSSRVTAYGRGMCVAVSSRWP